MMIFSILIGAMLCAVQAYVTLSFDVPLASTGDLRLYAILAVSAAFSVAVVRFVELRRGKTSTLVRLIQLLGALVLSAVLIAVLLPEISQSQLFYYVVAVIALGVVVIALPEQALRHRFPNITVALRRLWASRQLLFIWVSNNVRARYSQALLGILWIILLPLTQALILSFVFSRFIRIDVGDAPFISFFLAALIPWSFFNQTLINSTGAVTGMMLLINQIYFPREILVLVKLGETIVDVMFMFLALVVVNTLVGTPINVNYVYLPVLFIITVGFALGPALLLSCISVFVRDIPQLLFVALQMLFYLTPIIYPVSYIPPEFQSIVLINPLVPLVQAYRDVIVYQQAPNWISLHYTIVVAVVLLYLGYIFFKANERRLADFL